MSEPLTLMALSYTIRTVYVVFEADDLQGAIDLALRISAARNGGAIEIRPVAHILVVLCAKGHGMADDSCVSRIGAKSDRALT